MHKKLKSTLVYPKSVSFFLISFYKATFSQHNFLQNIRFIKFQDEKEEVSYPKMNYSKIEEPLFLNDAQKNLNLISRDNFNNKIIKTIRLSKSHKKLVNLIIKSNWIQFETKLNDKKWSHNLRWAVQYWWIWIDSESRN